jgi:hypothetical protein
MKGGRWVLAYTIGLAVLMVAAGWAQDLGASAWVGLEPAPTDETGNMERDHTGRWPMVAFLLPIALISLVLLCEREPEWAGRLLRTSTWSSFVLSAPYFFLIVLMAGAAAELVMVSPLSALLRPLAGFASGNATLLWIIYFALVAVVSLPALETWLAKRYR